MSDRDKRTLEKLKKRIGLIKRLKGKFRAGWTKERDIKRMKATKRKMKINI